MFYDRTASRLDAHVHLWNPQQFRMPWLDHEPTLNKPFGLAQYPRQGAGRTITGMVYVEVDVAPHYALLEARWAASLAAQDARLARHRCSGACGAWRKEYADYLMALNPIGPIIKGVRRNLQAETDRTFCLQPDFVRGVRLVAEYGFSFDICIRHLAMRRLLNWCVSVLIPGFILDHLGKPGIKDHVLDPWREHLAQLAALPNVWCKLSGLVTEADPHRWTPGDLAPYLAHALEVFGEDRVVFGGDWPVLLLASSYDQWIEVLDALTWHLSSEAKRKLWAENARHFYRL